MDARYRKNAAGPCPAAASRSQSGFARHNGSSRGARFEVIHVLQCEHWVEVRVDGQSSMRDMLQSLSKAPSRPGACLLIDVSAVKEVDPTAHALLGEHMALSLAGARKVAIVTTEDIVTYNSERAARRRSLNLCVFTERADAERWLREP
jgi:hypothetical protein